MGPSWLLAVALVAALPAGPAHARFGVYGQDDRQDLREVRDATLLRLARSVAAFFPASHVRIEGDSASLWTSPYGRNTNLDPSTRFYGQPQGAACTGALVAPDVVATAQHCVPADDVCPQIRLVFGFAIDRPGRDPTRVPAGDVYSCRRIVAQDFDARAYKPRDTDGTERLTRGGGTDWALVQLDRSVQGRSPLGVNKSGQLDANASLVLIGYPLGLPEKIAAGGRVRPGDYRDFFVSDVDSFQGNSGSPIINARTRLVEGLVARGDSDTTSVTVAVPLVLGNFAILSDPITVTRTATYAPNAGLGIEATRASAFSGKLDQVSPSQPASP